VKMFVQSAKKFQSVFSIIVSKSQGKQGLGENPESIFNTIV
jgi:hypothetical protein